MLVFCKSLGVSLGAAILVLVSAPASGALTPDQKFGITSAGLSRWDVPAKRVVGVFDAAIRPDGGVALVGAFQASSNLEGPGLVAINSEGKLDRRFAIDRNFTIPKRLAHLELMESWAYAVTAQSDGKILLATNANVATARDRAACRCHAYRGGMAIWRLGRDGRLDPTFGDGGIAPIERLDGSVSDDSDQRVGGEITSLVLDSRGRIYAYMTAYEIRKGAGHARTMLVRLSSRGNLDRGFGRGGRIVEPLGWIHSGMREPVAAGVTRGGRIVTVRSANTRVRGHQGKSSVAFVRWYSRHGTPVRPRRGHGRVRTIRMGDASDYSLGAQVESNGDVLLDTDIWLPNGPSYGDELHRVSFVRMDSDGLLDQYFGRRGRLVLPMDPGVRYGSFRAIDRHGDGYRVVVTGQRFGSDKLEFSVMRLDGEGNVSGPIVPVPSMAGVDPDHYMRAFFQGKKLTLAGQCDEWDESCLAAARFNLNGAGSQP